MGLTLGTLTLTHRLRDGPVNNGWSGQVSGVGAGSDCRTAQLQGVPFLWTTMRPRWAVRGPSIRQG